MGYTKLFNEIVMSTVWQEPDHVRILWITMLAIKDRWHIVNASIPGLADASRISLKKCEDALKILSSPDKYSRSKDHGGRRIAVCDGGWTILNGEKYRQKMSVDERRDYNRIKQKEYRDRNKNVKSCVQIGTRCTHTDTEADTKEDIKKKIPKKKSLFEETDFSIWPETPNRQVFKDWAASKKGAKGSVSKTTMKTISGELHKLALQGITVDQALSVAESSSWRGFKAAWVINHINETGSRNENNQRDGRSRAKRVSDKLDQIIEKSRNERLADEAQR